MTSEDEKIETCRVAMKAALEAIQEYCGAAPRVVNIGGVEFSLPDEIYEILSRREDPGWKIERIADHGWTRREADKMCHELIRSKDPEKCVKHMTQSIAQAIVSGDELSDEKM